MGNYRKHWFTLIGVMIVCFSLLGYYGVEVYRTAPPIPQQVQTEDGRVLYTQEGILDGQTAWQSVGGMQLGSIWGHGAYQAPDWTADWLHRELLNWLDVAAERAHGRPACCVRIISAIPAAHNAPRRDWCNATNHQAGKLFLHYQKDKFFRHAKRQAVTVLLLYSDVTCA